jgi:hypothetical protein
LYQQNPYQQGFGGQESFQGQQANPNQQFNGNQQMNQGRQSYLQEQDLANLILSEFKRVARGYTSAVLEADNQQTRQVFEFLLQQTLHDHAFLYQQVQQINGYEDIPLVSQQDIQKELQKQSHTSPKLYSFVQSNQIGSFVGQGQQQYQMPNQQQSQMRNQMRNQMQSQQQNQGNMPTQQFQGMGQQPAFQTGQMQSAPPHFSQGLYGQSPPSYDQASGMGTGTAVGSGSAMGTGTGTGMGPGSDSVSSTGMGSGTGTPGFGTGTGGGMTAGTGNGSPSSDTSFEPAKSDQQSGSFSETGIRKSFGRKASLNRNESSKYSF